MELSTSNASTPKGNREEYVEGFKDIQISPIKILEMAMQGARDSAGDSLVSESNYYSREEDNEQDECEMEDQIDREK